MSTTTVTAKTTRLQRGIRLFADRGHEITRTEGGTYKIPSCTGDGHYVVYLDPDFTTCSCPDSRRAKSEGEYCKHVWAASTAAAKRRAARRRSAS
jgi:predicted nucleic acid-binding Zn finger protein